MLAAVQQAAKWRHTKRKGAGRPSTDLSLLLENLNIESCRLRLRLQLGEGAFASVRHGELHPPVGRNWPGSGEATPREVAVKLLHQQLHNKQEIELFVHEAELLRTLRHRNIVEFVGCGWRHSSLEDSAHTGSPPAGTPTCAKGEPSLPELLSSPPYASSVSFFYVQEYCSGGSLGELVRRQMVRPSKPLYSDADALRWSLHIAWALQYLHESRSPIMHRDLKLDNVMLSSANLATADAKLADFGLARIHAVPAPGIADSTAAGGGDGGGQSMPPASSRVDLTCTTCSQWHPPPPPPPSSSSSHSSLDVRACAPLTGRTGSFGYMAPEVLASRPYNASADIFSLGMCMYNLFARRIPGYELMLNWSSTTADLMETFAAEVAKGYRPSLPSRVPALVAEIIEACWEGDPSLRPNARTVVHMLEHIQESGGLGASAADTPMQGCTACSIM